MRLMNRATSMRASYTFTNFEGSKLYNNNFHEATISFGLRGREDTPKQFRDVVRVILSTVQAKGFSTYTAGLGFKF
jgi:ubiquinone/menaquinone biosynthesis C-methylase UbiE